MTELADRGSLLERARHADEETRYRATRALDPASPRELDELTARLDDESWRVRTAAVDRLAEGADPAAVVPRLVRALDGGDSPGGREAAAVALVRLGTVALPAVLACLDGPDPGPRLAALPVVGALGDRRAAPRLAACLADPDPNVRAAAADALGRLGGAEASAALLAALESDDATLRAAALDALGALRLAPPTERMASLVAARALRPSAFRALAWSDEPAALELLVAGLGERSRSAREAALWAIGQQRLRRGLEAQAQLAGAVRRAALRQPTLQEDCLPALAAEDPLVATGALAVFGWLGEPRHATAMVRRADDDRLRPLVEEALEGLGGGPVLVAALAAALPELSPLARISALAALAAAGQAAALQELAKGSADPDPQVQAEAVAALGRVGDPRAVASLGGLLGDDVPALAGVAASALTRIALGSEEGRRAVLAECRARADAGPSAALFRILGAAGAPDDLGLLRRALVGGPALHRIAAASAVASLGQRGLLGGQRLPELAAALADVAWSVRAAAARAFLALALDQAGRWSTSGPGPLDPLCQEALPALAAALEDGEPSVRAAAVEALGACARPEHAARIAAVAADPAVPPLVAMAAFRALARLGSAPMAVLEAGLAHPDPEVAKEAVSAAAGAPGEAGRRLLGLAARSPRWDVRHAAARAMAERGDPGLEALAARLAAEEPDGLVARAFAEAALGLAGRPVR